MLVNIFLAMFQILALFSAFYVVSELLLIQLKCLFVLGFTHSTQPRAKSQHSYHPNHQNHRHCRFQLQRPTNIELVGHLNQIIRYSLCVSIISIGI